MDVHGSGTPGGSRQTEKHNQDKVIAIYRESVEDTSNGQNMMDPNLKHGEPKFKVMFDNSTLEHGTVHHADRYKTEDKLKSIDLDVEEKCVKPPIGRNTSSVLKKSNTTKGKNFNNMKDSLEAEAKPDEPGNQSTRTKPPVHPYDSSYFSPGAVVSEQTKLAPNGQPAINSQYQSQYRNTTITVVPGQESANTAGSKVQAESKMTDMASNYSQKIK